MYKIEQYDDNCFRIICTKENNFVIYNDKEHHITDDEELERISISRAKRRIRQYSKCNNFKYFITVTINSVNCDRYSLSDSQKLLRKTLKFYKRKNHDFGYLFITEKHEDGAYHFHGLIKGINEEDLIELKKEDFSPRTWYKMTKKLKPGQKLYSLKYFDTRIGFITLTVIDDLARATTYICKYISKSPIRSLSNYLYINSRGLKLPISYDILPIDLTRFSGYKSFYENDFCKTFDFDLSELDSSDVLYLMSNIKQFV